MRARVLGLAVLLLTFLVVVAACSGDDGDDGARERDTDRAVTTTRPSSTSSSAPPTETVAPGDLRVEEFAVPAGSRPHDVAVADDGTVWYTAQGSGELGRLDSDHRRGARRSPSATGRGPTA